MSLVLNEDQNMLRETAARFLSERSPVSALRALRDERHPDGFDRALWKEMAELGWAGLIVPEEHGGSGFGHVGLGLVLEETGRRLTASPLVSTALLGAGLVASLGTDGQKERLFPSMVAGEHITALALEEGTHHAPFAIAASATANADGFVLNGVKRFVLDGHVADSLIVVARTGEGSDERDGLSLFLVDPALPGVRVTRSWMVDSRNAANVELNDVTVPAESLLGGPAMFGRAGPGLEKILDVGRVGVAAEMVGGAREVFERTLEYLKLRDQFGVKIGSFQALQHRAATIFTEIELVISAVRAALVALEQENPDIALLASLAKAKANEVFVLVSNEGIQMYGGIGMTDDEEIGFFLKRARVAQQTLGDTRYHRSRYAGLCGY